MPLYIRAYVVLQRTICKISCISLICNPLEIKTLLVVEVVHRIMFCDTENMDMPHVNNLNIPEYMIVL